jgi:glycosyltransferase involved in cell wall biosynthesis
MRVGVLLGDKRPEEGGGYTFEHEILDSLVTLCADTHHTFVLLSQAKHPPQFGDTDGIQSLSLYRCWIARAFFQLSQTVMALFNKLRQPAHPCKIAHWSEPAILRSGVDVIWHLTPTWLTAEVPAIVMVWELQHRLQPYFPEMSAQGEWDERERSYGAILRRAAYVIAGTEAGKSEIERFYQVPAERIKLLPHPTPRYALKAAPSGGTDVLENYHLPETYVFYPAQFWAHKNHLGLLLAMRCLRDQYGLDIPLVLAGSDKGNEAYIRQMMAELDLVSQVYFVGFVGPDDLIALYRHACCLAYITFCGPENLPPLEAFALGCPVVASEVAGAREQLGDAALLVDPKQPEQIARAIKSLQGDAVLRQTLIERGFKRASQFTGEDFVRGIFDVLDEFEPIRRCWSSDVSYQAVKDGIQQD